MRALPDALGGSARHNANFVDTDYAHGDLKLIIKELDVDAVTQDDADQKGKRPWELIPKQIVFSDYLDSNPKKRMISNCERIVKLCVVLSPT